MDTTMAVTGLLIKVSAIMLYRITMIISLLYQQQFSGPNPLEKPLNILL